jgi:large subunit ribosomal protein L24
MKKEFSNSWKASKLPRKQRKYLANAPLNIKHKLISANLAKKLREKHKRRSFPLRKGDNVKIMRGEFKKKSGKIDIVNLKRLRVTIEGIHKTKKDGTKIKVYFNPSNLQIQELNLDDKKRIEAIQRKNEKPKENKKEQVNNEIKIELKKSESKKLEGKNASQKK